MDDVWFMNIYNTDIICERCRGLMMKSYQGCVGGHKRAVSFPHLLTPSTSLCFNLQRVITIRLNPGMFSTKRFKTSANEVVTSCIYKDYVVTHRHTPPGHTHDYYNPPPTRSGELMSLGLRRNDSKMPSSQSPRTLKLYLLGWDPLVHNKNIDVN